MSAWRPALDALEEWLRRTTDEVAGFGVPTPAPAMPDEPVPPGLQLRARLLMIAMRDLEADLAKRREQLARKQAYGAA